MGRFGLGTRAAMCVIGAIWAIAGALWLWALLPARLDRHSIDAALDEPVWLELSTVLLVCGVMLVKSAVTPDRPKSFEDEIPDAHPNLDGWDD